MYMLKICNVGQSVEKSKSIDKYAYSVKNKTAVKQRLKGFFDILKYGNKMTKKK